MQVEMQLRYNDLLFFKKCETGAIDCETRMARWACFGAKELLFFLCPGQAAFHQTFASVGNLFSPPTTLNSHTHPLFLYLYTHDFFM
jgi:hypothetical protein